MLLRAFKVQTIRVVSEFTLTRVYHILRIVSVESFIIISIVYYINYIKQIDIFIKLLCSNDIHIRILHTYN